MAIQTKTSSTRSKRIVIAKHASPSHDEIAEAAYYLAEKRDFKPGHETEDWLKAEQQLHDGSGPRM